jgi:hypothetical protein
MGVRLRQLGKHQRLRQQLISDFIPEGRSGKQKEPSAEHVPPPAPANTLHRAAATRAACFSGGCSALPVACLFHQQFSPSYL